jgi:tetratricopeptide (TPR) repeat protein
MKTASILLLAGFLLSGILPDQIKPAPHQVIEGRASSTPYDKAVLLLHNFEYEDAAELFISTQEKDPGFAMAYWGEAMTYDHPIWGDLNIDKARAALRKLGNSPEERISNGRTALEKDMIKSTEILFGDGSKPDRQKKYSQFMESLYRKYPGNNEVAAFYSLSLLGAKKGWNEWEEQNVEAARIAREILKSDPDHPGALHYLVHANDHPQHAADGLDAANKYAIAASYAGHALHMPSHIYLALGMWDDVVRSNEVSWKASVDRKEEKKLTNDFYSYHSHLWLQYGYLQQGRFSRARELLNDQVRYCAEMPSASARVHLLQMKGHYLFETDEWFSAIADLPVKTDDVMTGSQYNNVLIEGYKAFARKDAASLLKVTRDFEKKLNNDMQLQKSNENMTICGVTRFVNAVPTAQDILGGKKLLKKLQAMQAWMSNDLKKAEELLKESLPAEGSVVVGPPFFLLSSHELYGRFLLSQKRPAEAYDQFGKALLASPNRIISLKGQLQSARMLKDGEKEKTIATRLEKNLKNADPKAKVDL